MPMTDVQCQRPHRRIGGDLARGRSRNEKRDPSVLAVLSEVLNSTTESYLATLAEDSTGSQRRGSHGAICFIDVRTPEGGSGSARSALKEFSHSQVPAHHTHH